MKALVVTLALVASPALAQPIVARTAGTPADMVSGGDIRVEVEAPAEGLRFTVNGRPQDVALIAAPAGVSGVVTGLRDGANEVTVSAPGRQAARLRIVNHPMSGPIFSGKQLDPWICARPVAAPATADRAPVEASGLAGEPDAGCQAAPVMRLYYRTTATDCRERVDTDRPCFLPYDPAATRPADIATLDGRDYVVQVERGAVNRGLYDLAVLYDPAVRKPTWNSKMVWYFGGSGGNQRRQTPPASNWMNDDALRHGFMVGVSNLTDGSRNNNRVLAAETLMMMREYVSDHYGPVRHVIGEGCSAGSMQQMVIGTMYPGLLDGSLIACSFPDSDSLSLEITDAFLFKHYFDSAGFRAAMAGKPEAEVSRIRAAMTGHKDDGTTEGWARFRPGYLPGVLGEAPASNGCKLPNGLIWDPKTNPTGLRCTTPDLSVNIWGTYPGTVKARQFRDNVGVQYGLAALLSGAISGEDFVRLNEGIGGLDIDGEFSEQRVEGDRSAIDKAYRHGLVSDGKVLARMPIIDLRGSENSDVHANWHSFALRERIKKEAGSLANHAMWRVGLPLKGAPWIDNPSWRATGLPLRSLLTMDRWLDAVDADTAAGSRAEKVARNRPADLRTFCYLGTDYRTEVPIEATCDRDPALHYYTGTRQTAGAPFTSEVLKCALRPVDVADYRGKLSDTQMARVRALFTSGVCDWSKPGVGFTTATPWQRF